MSQNRDDYSSPGFPWWAKGLMWLTGIVVAIMALASPYNSQVDRYETALQKASDVQVQMKRRADLVPQLVNTVKGAAAQERQVLEAVTEARAKATQINVDPAKLVSDPKLMEQFLAAQSQLGGALSRLLALSERYPELKSIEAFNTLQSQLEGTENRIAVARRDANIAVRDHNAGISRFPGSFYAGLTGYTRMANFEIAEGDKAVPEVKFN